MTTPQKLAFLQGKVNIFERGPAGQRLNGLWAGIVDELSFDITVEKDELKEAHTGNNTTASTVITGTTFKGSLKGYDFSLKQVLRNLQATVTPVAAGSATGVEVAVDPEAGQVFALDHINLSACVLKNGATTLVVDEDYSIDLATGRGNFITAQTGTVTADPTWDAYSEADAMKASQKDYILDYAGKNKVDGLPYVVIGWKVRFDPATGFGVIGRTHASYTQSFDVLSDEFRSDKTLTIKTVEAA